MSVQAFHEPRCDRRSGQVELLILSRVREVGDVSVRRVLPTSARQGVGPFVFLDHIGPVHLPPGRGLDIRPHPHIGLATLTYLFEGVLLHRDSLGSVQPITTGAVSCMTAGHGIVHSERTPEAERVRGTRLHGLQMWMALPTEDEVSSPKFEHHPETSVPRIALPGAEVRVVVGQMLGWRGPVQSRSRALCLTIDARIGARIALPIACSEWGVYVVSGDVDVLGTTVGCGCLAVVSRETPLALQARSGARLVVLGGDALDVPRHIWWNFVSTSRERIRRARFDWMGGCFPEVPGDRDCTPLPDR